MIAKILTPTPKMIQIAANAILGDEVVGLPTETVYGLAGNSHSYKALLQIFKTKQRPHFDPLILHVPLKANQVALLEAIGCIDASFFSKKFIKKINQLLEHFWPGPLTLVLPKHPSIPDLATSGLKTVGIRMPKHPVAQALLEASQCVLAAPSANRFGRISPTTAQAVANELGNKINWILDGGPCGIGIESTILSVSPEHERWSLLRPGGTPLEKLKDFLGNSFSLLNPINSKKIQTLDSTPTAPGSLESHYAPEKPLYLLPKPLEKLTPSEIRSFLHSLLNKIKINPKIGLLLLKTPTTPFSLEAFVDSSLKIDSLSQIFIKTLSSQGDVTEAAQTLFQKMRELDRPEISFIFAEPCLDKRGLGFAISDRLKRAAAKEL